MTGNQAWRDRARRGVEAYLRKRSLPRLMLAIILALTAAVGFTLSFSLLKAGLDQMGLRYPLAVIGAYGAFLVLMRVWVDLEQRRFDPSDPVIRTALEEDAQVTAAARHSRKSSCLDWLDLPTPDLDVLGEGCLPALLLGILAALAALLVGALMIAPTLLAEVFVDAFLAGVLYRRLHHAAQENWLGTAIRRTWWFVLATAVLLGLAGWCLSLMAPGAPSIGPALDQILNH